MMWLVWPTLVALGLLNRGSVDAVAESCYLCGDCIYEDDYAVLMTAVLSSLGTTGGSEYLATPTWTVDSFDGSGDNLAPSCNNGSMIMDELTIAETSCVTVEFVLNSADGVLGTCRLMTAQEEFFNATVTGDDMKDLAALSASELMSDIDVVLEAFDGVVTGWRMVTFCDATDNCQTFTAPTVHTADSNIGAWNDDYEDDTSAAYLGVVADMEAIIAYMVENDPSVTDGSFTGISKAAASSRRQKRSTSEAEVQFEVETVAGGEVSADDVAESFDAAVANSDLEQTWESPEVVTEESGATLVSATAALTLGLHVMYCIL